MYVYLHPTENVQHLIELLEIKITAWKVKS